MNAPTLATVDSMSLPSNQGVRTAIVKEMVTGSGQKLHVEGDDLNRLIGRKNGSSLSVADLLLLKRSRMIVEVPRSQKGARHGSRNSGRDSERAFRPQLSRRRDSTIMPSPSPSVQGTLYPRFWLRDHFNDFRVRHFARAGYNGLHLRSPPFNQLGSDGETHGSIRI